MTAINHGLTGVAIAAAISNPWLALPLAFLSHLGLDILPHFGEEDGKRTLRSWAMWGIDFVLSTSLILYLISAVVGGDVAGIYFGAFIVAISPDFSWFKHKVIDSWLLGEEVKKTAFDRLHSSIQHFEVSFGWIFEIAWFAMIILILRDAL